MKKAIFLVETILHCKDNTKNVEYYVVKFDLKELMQFDTIDFKTKVHSLFPQYVAVSIRGFEIGAVQYIGNND